jgi:hypothetical protein
VRRTFSDQKMPLSSTAAANPSLLPPSLPSQLRHSQSREPRLGSKVLEQQNKLAKLVYCGESLQWPKASMAIKKSLSVGITEKEIGTLNLQHFIFATIFKLNF